MDSKTSGEKILLAVSAAAVDRFRRVLDGHRLEVAATVDQAKGALEAGEYACVILCVTFDESRMFELLRLARTYDCNRVTPVLCVLSGETVLSDVAIEGLDHAVKAMLANAFLNLHKFPDDEDGNGRVRRIIDYLILIDGDMHGGVKAVHGENTHR